MPPDIWTPMLTSKPSLRNKSLRARNKFAHVEVLRGLARPVPQYAVTVTYRNQKCKKKKDFQSSKKEQGQKTKKRTTTFGKSLSLIKYRMHYTVYTPPNTKDLAINQAMVACGNQQTATAVQEQSTPIFCDHWNI